jgi:hypothetical protein
VTSAADPARLSPPDFDDEFGDGSCSRTLDPERWIDHYLPHWTTADRSRARYRIAEAGLGLVIEPDQPEWRPEDAPLVVSSIQTGTFSGDEGTSTGIHRHRPDGMVVRSPQRRRMLWAPRAGRVDVTLSPAVKPGYVTAAWLVGTEEFSAEDCGEICLVELELIADPSGHEEVVARTGVKAHGDPRLSTEMRALDPDPTWGGLSTWSVEWGSAGTTVSVDGREVFATPQHTTYPLILLVGLFRVTDSRPAETVTAWIRRVRGWTVGD